MQRLLSLGTLALLLVGGAAVRAQKAPFADGAANPGFQVPLPVALKAPDATPLRLDLPKTTLPPDAGQDQFGYRLVGYSQPVAADPLANAVWQEMPDGGRVLRVELTSPGATGLRVQLTDTRLAHLELRVYKPGAQVVYGPYTLPHLDPDGTWW